MIYPLGGMSRVGFFFASARNGSEGTCRDSEGVAKLSFHCGSRGCIKMVYQNAILP